jgi:hypothetical protein
MLLKVLRMTSGSVLELGVGWFSTPMLHYICMDMNRVLISYDSDKKFVDKFKEFSNDTHKIEFIEDWDKADILKPWSMAFIDHSPGPRRGMDAGRLSQYAEYVICHDSEQKRDHIYEYGKIYSLFKYRWNYTKLWPHTVVLSNFHDLSQLEE